MAKYKRVLIKLSGEALGDHGRLFDFEQIDRVADVIRQLHETGAEIAIVIGAGNIWRAVYLSPGCASSGKGTWGHLCLRHGQSVLLHRYGGGVARG